MNASSTRPQRLIERQGLIQANAVPSAAGTDYHGGNRITSSAEQDSIKIVGSTWMRYINSGYFD